MYLLKIGKIRTLFTDSAGHVTLYSLTRTEFKTWITANEGTPNSALFSVCFPTITIYPESPTTYYLQVFNLYPDGSIATITTNPNSMLQFNGTYYH